MKIGLSLSLCIRAIIMGKVQEDEVACIICHTRIPFDDADAWSRTIATYETDYWKANPALAKDLVAKFRRTGRIVQPRLEKPEFVHSTGEGIWLELPGAPGFAHQ